MIREVEIRDIEGIREIYNYYVENTSISFEETKISYDEMSTRVMNIAKEYPYLVYEEDLKVVAYAYITRWKARSAYRFTLEASVYVEAGYTGKGLGSLLYEALLKLIPDCHSIMAVVAQPNEASNYLHKKFGFEEVAYFKEVGFKFNKWVDVAYYQKMF